MNHTARNLACLGLLLSLLTPQLASAQRHDRDGGGGREGRDSRDFRMERREGERVRQLPRDRAVIDVQRSRYYYDRGAFYRPYGRQYVVVRPPIGARVRYLPYGYSTFWLGPSLFYLAGSSYYRWEPREREYIVVDKPDGADRVASSQPPSESTQIFAYPKQGQSEAQTERDRYDCYLWSVRQSGFDPAEPGERTDLIPDYRRAMTACLEGRGYSVQ
jgi:hypothetical protein